MCARACQEPYELPGGDHRIHSGLQEALERLGAGLDIRYRHRVASLRLRPDAAWCTDSGLVVAGVVVTVPLGALRAGSLTFEPVLPRPFQDALGRIGAGPVAKLFVAYERRWWPPFRPFRFLTLRPNTPEPRLCVGLDVTAPDGRVPMLLFFAVGESARALEGCSEAELCAVVDQVVGSTGFADWDSTEEAP